MPNGILIASVEEAQLRVAYANDSALMLLGSDREACVGHDLLVLLQQRPANARLTSLLRATLACREACTARMPPAEADATLGCRLTLVPLEIAGATSAWLIVLDEAPVELDGQAAPGDHRIDTIIDLVSHQLRAPLNSALTWASLLEIDRSPKTLDRAVDVIKKSIYEQARLIDDLIDVSRIGRRSMPLDAEPLDLPPWLEQTLALVRPTLPANMSLEYSTEAASCHVNANEPQLQRAVRHLIDNATKFTPDGGTITLKLRTGDGCAIIEVTDQGVGLTNEEIARAFEPFWRARKNARGGGLGLGVVQAIVARHGGAVSARSPGADKGATFTVSLPLRD